MIKVLNILFVTSFIVFIDGDILNRITTDNLKQTIQQPLTVNWEDLIDINYEVKYFKEYEMDISTPVFGSSQKALDGKEILITGFVIPFDENTEYLSLSANPYASCFFCGNASPASVISMYMKNPGKRYMIDDFKTFKGTLHLNYDNPDEFIYILEDAEEVKDK